MPVDYQDFMKVNYYTETDEIEIVNKDPKDPKYYFYFRSPYDLVELINTNPRLKKDILKILLEGDYKTNKQEDKYKEMKNSFDLLFDADKLEEFLSKLPEDERSSLYNHPLLEEYDLLP